MNTGYNAQRRIEELLDLTNKQMLELGELRTQAHRSGIIAKENGTLRAENAGLKAENERLRSALEECRDWFGKMFLREGLWCSRDGDMANMCSAALGEGGKEKA